VRRNRDPRRIYFAIAFTQAAASTLAYLLHALFLIDRVHVDPLGLVLVGTTMEATVLLFEVPSGIVADIVSRRLSVQIGFTIMAGAWLVEAAIPTFAVVVLSQVLWAIGYTFTSGATQAWLAGEIGDDHVRPVLIRASQVRMVTAIGAIPFAIVLGTISLRLPIFAAALLTFALAAFLVLTMPEEGFVRGRVHRIGESMLATARDGLGAIRGRTVLMLMLPVALFLGASSEAIDRLWVKHVGDIGLDLTTRGSIVTIGVIEGLGLLGGALILQLVRRRVDMRDEQRLTRLLIVLLTLQTAAMFAFGLVGAVLVALPLFLAYDIARGTQDSIYEAWLVPLIPPDVRATVLSTYGQADAVGQVVGGPMLGLIASRRSTAAAMVTGAAFLLPALAVLVAIRRRVAAAVVGVRAPVTADAVPLPESR
jgi:DHA3 family tetracycline resistance protein-like MFS transporter